MAKTTRKYNGKYSWQKKKYIKNINVAPYLVMWGVVILFFSARCICLVLFISKNFYFLRPFYVLSKKIPVHKNYYHYYWMSVVKWNCQRRRVCICLLYEEIFFDETTNSDLKAQNHILNEWMHINILTRSFLVPYFNREEAINHHTHHFFLLVLNKQKCNVSCNCKWIVYDKNVPK